jgi:hypothetical protein
VIRVEGNCPMGCGRTLHVEEATAANKVICWGAECSDPLAAHKILGDSETEHVVRFDGGGFTVRHPLRERLGDELMNCRLHLFCVSLPGPPEGRPGTFRAWETDGRWQMERLEEEPEAETS